MEYKSTIFPAQKLPLKNKNKEWRESCVNYIAGMSNTTSSGGVGSGFNEMQINYNLYNGIFDKKDLQYVINPFNQDDGFPASPQNFNIIKPNIDLLIGEETGMPYRMSVIRTSDHATSAVIEKTRDMVVKYMMASIMAEMGPQEAQEYQSKLESGEIMPPESIAKFMQSDYKDSVEDAAYHSLRYLKEKLNIDHEFSKGWKDALISGKEVYYVGVVNGEPSFERVNPLYFSHDSSPDLEFIEDGAWACRRMRMDYTDAYDMLSEKMTEKDLDKLIEMVDGGDLTGNKIKMGNSIKDDYNHMRTRVFTNPENIRRAGTVDVWHTTWKSFKKIGFVSIIDENGDTQEIVVSEDYLAIGNEINIEWKWVTEVWEGYRIGSNYEDAIFVGIQPVQHLSISEGNLNSQKLPYCGAIYNNMNTKSKSLVSIMKPLQYMYIIIWYRLELAIARDKGKILNMDITQIPKSMNIDPAKWMHYLSSIGVNFINPYEEGWDIPGRQGGNASAFNQIASVDLTMANVINEYIGLLSKIEDMIGEISGVSRQRRGTVTSSELVGTVEQSVTQSALITQPLFWVHNQCKKRASTALINVAKEAWKNSKRKNIQYVLGDSTRAFIDLSDDFYYEDFDVFLSNASKDFQNLEQLKALYQPAMQNGTTLYDVAEIMTMDNITEIKNKLKELEQLRAQQQQAIQDAENQRQMQLIDLQNKYKEDEYNLRKQELDLKKYEIDTKNETTLVAAELNAYRNNADVDSDADGIPDVMEIANLAMKQREIYSKESSIQMDNQLRQDESNNSREIEKAKLDIEKNRLGLENKKLNTQKEIQRMKDRAAMAREELKAKTALKNKASGEK